MVVWGRLAEALTPYLVKGKQIGVEGELRQNRWEQDGQPRSRVEINANNIQLLGGRSGQQGERAPMGGDDEARGVGAPGADTGASSGFSGDDFDDDIPF